MLSAEKHGDCGGGGDRDGNLFVLCGKLSTATVAFRCVIVVGRKREIDFVNGIQISGSPLDRQKCKTVRGKYGSDDPFWRTSGPVRSADKFSDFLLGRNAFSTMRPEYSFRRRLKRDYA